jgi:hypothetical protein
MRAFYKGQYRAAKFAADQRAALTLVHQLANDAMLDAASAY